MEIKFNKSLNEYRYVLSFDLAKVHTGWSLLDIADMKLIDCGVIDTSDYGDHPWRYFYKELFEVFVKTQKRNIDFFIVKEKLPSQNGPHSTVATLQELAKTHAIFDLALQVSSLPTYDFCGVHSVSEKAYFKKLTDLEKPTKQDIFNQIKKMIDLNGFDDNINLDISDSIAVSLTLINKKWNSDIDEEIKNKKKELKKSKTDKKINRLQEEIDFLNSLKEARDEQEN